MAEFTQPSFSAGEISPAAYGRVDLAKYTTALKTCRNFLTRVHGGVVNRPGTEFVMESESGRFIPFIFNENQAYILDFRHLNMILINQGGIVLEAEKIATLDNGFPVTFTITDHGYSNNDLVYIRNTNLPPVNNQFWRIINVTANSFQLDSLPIQGSGAEGIVARVFKATTPFAYAQLPFLSFAQLRDVMTFAINTLRPKNLLRRGHTNWTFEDTVFEDGPFQDINVDNSKTMLVSAEVGSPVTVTTNFDVFTSDNIGQLIYIEQKDYGIPWEVAKAVTVGDDRRSEGKYYRTINTGTTGTLRPFGEVPGVQEHDGSLNWEYMHSGYGIGEILSVAGPTQATIAVLSRMPAALLTTSSFKWAIGAWGGDQGWPAVVTYFQQRRTFFSTPAKPEFVWMSGKNAYTFFGESTPIVDDDSVTIQLVAKRVSPVRFAVDLGKLILFTASGKWVIPDDDNNPILTPSKRSARSQGALGASNVLPVIVEDSILYVVEKGQTVQDISYQFVSNAYSGKDLSVLSKHLFEKHRIVAAAYQHVPFQINWLVREDGVLIGVTYLREHEVWGWHIHDSINGFVEDVCVIPEGQEDRVYLKIRRVINGQVRWYTERLASRLYTDIRDAHFVDCGLKYDGRNRSLNTMTIVAVPSTGGGFGEGGFGEGGFGQGLVSSPNYKITSSNPIYFHASQIGDEIHIQEGNRVYRFEIISILTTDIALTKAPGVIVPISILNTPILAWTHAKSTVPGYKHLEGQTLSVLVDGKVHPQVMVVDGIIDLQYAGGVVVAGLPIEADFETLNLNAPAAGSLLDREKCLFAARFMVEESRGIFAGPDKNHLDEYVQRENEFYDDPVNLKTGLISIRVDSTWEPGGRVFVRQVDPLPVSILNVMPDVDIGGAR